MELKKLFSSIAKALRSPAAAAIDTLTAKDPAFAGKLARAKDIVAADYSVLSAYLPPQPFIAYSPIGAMAVMPNPTALDLLTSRARTEAGEQTGQDAFTAAFRRTVEKTCAEGRQLQTEADVRTKYPHLFRPSGPQGPSQC